MQTIPDDGLWEFTKIVPQYSRTNTKEQFQ